MHNMFILQLVHMVKVPQNDLLSSKLISVLAVQCCQIFLYSKVPRAVNWNTGTLRQDYTRLYFCRIFVDFFFSFFFFIHLLRHAEGKLPIEVLNVTVQKG